MSDTDLLPAEPETRKAFGQPLAGLYDKPIMTAEQHILQEQRRFPGASGEFSWLLSGITLATKLIQAKSVGPA